MTSSGWPGLPRPGPRHRQLLPTELHVATRRAPTDAELADLRFAWSVVKQRNPTRSCSPVGPRLASAWARPAATMPSSSRSAGPGSMPAAGRASWPPTRSSVRRRPARRHRGRRHRGHPARRQRARSRSSRPPTAGSPCCYRHPPLSPLRPDMRRPLAALALLTLAACSGPSPYRNADLGGTVSWQEKDRLRSRRHPDRLPGGRLGAGDLAPGRPAEARQPGAGSRALRRHHDKGMIASPTARCWRCRWSMWTRPRLSAQGRDRRPGQARDGDERAAAGADQGPTAAGRARTRATPLG